MFVISQNRSIMVNMDHVERVYVTEKEDNVIVTALVHACDSRSTPTVTLGRYASVEEAKSTMWKLMASMEECNSFEMPEGKKDEIVKDARVKRRGGS